VSAATTRDQERKVENHETPGEHARTIYQVPACSPLRRAGENFHWPPPGRPSSLATMTTRATVAMAALMCASAGLARADGEVDALLAKLRQDDRATRAMGAIGVQHLAARRWGAGLLPRAALRPWQRELAPAVPLLVQMLDDDRGLEWIDEQGASQSVTTPRREATLALLALERPSVEPLIEALGQPALAHKADEVLRRVTRGGPAGHDAAAWQSWWRAHREQALPNERGHLLLLAIGLCVLAGATALVFRRQRAGQRRLGLQAP
jgi:hypothetical protein